MNKHCHLWIIALVMLLGGCLPFKHESGRSIDAALLRGIIPEKTEKDDLYKLCGWPRAIMLPEETASIGVIPRVGRGGYRVDTAAHFEIFARRLSLGEAHQIIYYEHLTHRTYSMLLYSEGETTADRLWVLVNEETGLVEDYAYKKHGKPMIFAGALKMTDSQ